MTNEEKNYKSESIPLDFFYMGKKYTGSAMPLSASCHEDVCFEFIIKLNGESLGFLSCDPGLHWTMSGFDQDFVNNIGEEIVLWYEQYSFKKA